MAKFLIPVFEHGTILTTEMLEVLKNYQIDLGELSYAGYVDGIVSGCEVSMSGNLLYVNRGIVMFDQKLFFLPSNMQTTVQEGNDWQVLWLTVGVTCSDKNFTYNEVSLETSSNLNGDDNRIEVCRFRLQSGATLRNKYRDFNDLETEFDTVNELYAGWSSYKGKSISKRVLDEFAANAIKQGVSNQTDITFIQQILALDNRTMNRAAINFYLYVRLQKSFEQADGKEIYKGLQEVLRTLKSGNAKQSIFSHNERRIIVD